MAKITLENLRHSYMPDPKGPEDYALRHINLDWRDGGAYALLGPSGCGKSTLLNIISGLVHPSEGKILFDGENVTELSPDHRNIAQVFQFPVIYDTMTVYDNLAFPLRNRGVAENKIDARVREIAQMLELDDILKTKAAGLSPDNKQKISMGRGLVRDDVNVIMFDEPLTVIDPHLKWKLRSKLKELHQKVNVTMIYVTHDQTEALTFADQVVVMQDGDIVQIGTPVELFERPGHTFVGHFIGSPGMNVLPCEVKDGSAYFNGQKVVLAGETNAKAGTRTEIGIRPEFISIAEAGATNGIEADVVKTSDIGRHSVVETKAANSSINVIVEGKAPQVGDKVHLQFDPQNTRVYADDWLAMVDDKSAPQATLEQAQNTGAKS